MKQLLKTLWLSLIAVVALAAVTLVSGMIVKLLIGLFMIGYRMV